MLAMGGISASIQFSLPLMWTASKREGISKFEMHRLMSLNPATLAGLEHRKVTIQMSNILFMIEYVYLRKIILPSFQLSLNNMLYHLFQRDVSCLDLMRILLYGIPKQSLWLMPKTYCVETKIHLLTSEKNL